MTTAGASALRGKLVALAIEAERLCDRMLGRAWVSYALISALQLKIIWKIWAYRDLTTGDTSSYFTTAYDWYSHFKVNIVWSPLYTAFYGALLSLTEDVYAATILHRVIIVMAATLGVLALMRQLLPPALALLIGAWWALLPINFETLYEVHLFALLPILASWLVMARGDTPWRRGCALGILIATAVLVRNEIILAAGLFALACLVREYWDAHRDATKKQSWRARLVPYVVPAGVALCLCALFYWRSTERFPHIFAALDDKHTVNMCQVYAVGYSQRHPTWNLNPWIECQGLAKETFGHAYPTLLQMIRNNPSAAFEHFLWNLSLTFNGFQVGLFNAMSGTVNPDYAPVRHAVYALVLSLIALGLVFAAAIKAGHDWNFWWQAFFREQLSLWLLMLSVLCVAIPVILVQRPRPSYLFSVTVVLMAMVGTAVHILLAPRGQQAAKVVAVVGVIVLILIMPSYYIRHRSDRSLYMAFERLRPFGSVIERSGNKILFGDYNGELRGYLHLRRSDSTYDYSLLKAWQPPQRLEHFLDEKQVNVAFIQPRVMPELRARPEARVFLDNPESVGWRRLAPPAGSDESWLLLYKEPSAPTQ